MGGVEGIAVMVDDVAMPKYNDNRKLGLILLIYRTEQYVFIIISSFEIYD